MDFTSTDRLVVTELLETQQTDLFAIHEKYSLSPAQLFNSLQKLSQIGIAKEQDGMISLDDNALAVIFANRQSIFRREYPWRQIPDAMLCRRIEVGSAYTPNWRKLGDDLREQQIEFRRGMKAQGRKG